ncbi:lysosomal protective protein [Alligator mississippiensis]|uniref:lysosomal protective protein n=1 Tax=Alligator mississippiensis TaxID=8496 RepID=UPI0007116BDA|nr:lysosomal protective protein [Alligator mississippiensis]
MKSPCSLTAICYLCLGLCSGHYAPDLITSLPGLSEMPSFQQWSGYLEAGPGHYFHYWFVESQGNPATDPVVVWLNGGPGCSSMEGFLAENGPLHLNDDGMPYLNPYSWNKVANMLYLESPAGVGYSYSDFTQSSISDNQVAEDNYQALQSFFAKFPAFRNNDFYVFGESYGGIYVPTLSAKIVKGSANFNFKGFGVGNGMTSYYFNEVTLMEFAYYHGVFGDELWALLNKNCCYQGTCNYINNTNSNCITAILPAYERLYGIGLNMYNLYASCWGGANYQERYEADLSNLFRQYQFNVPVPKVGSIPGVPRCINATAMYIWLNRDDVRQALHIPSSLPNWELCSSQVRTHYKRIYMDMAPFYQTLLKHDLRALVYNGDVDMVCNFLGSEKFVESLNKPMLKSYQPWYYNNQIAGFFNEYEKITFLTVKGAGHMVPQYKPGQALKMFQCFLSNTTYV